MINAALFSLKNVEETSNINIEIDHLKQFGFILGTIDLYNPVAEQIESVALSDIPIAATVFQNWFRKNVVEKDLEKLSFISFVRRICTELVVGCLKNMRTYKPRGGPLNTQMSISALLLHKSRLKNKTGGRIKTSQIGRKSSSGNENPMIGLSFSDINKLTQYLFLYIGNTTADTLRGDQKADEAAGIFWARVGSSTGIVKRIQFKRTDLPFQREARILGASEQAQANLLFSDHYNAEISMIGNAIFKPGMLIFVDPTAMGYQMNVAIRSSQIMVSRASQLGIGGYYMVSKVNSVIESGKFETSLSLIAQAPVFASRKVGGGVFKVLSRTEKRKIFKDRVAKAVADGKITKKSATELESLGGDDIGIDQSESLIPTDSADRAAKAAIKDKT